tara:strand:- start:560 stop:1576 length:1017 start_codon:yes stop_codon:yes gene_type:complete
VDYAKAIGIILVVYGHVIRGIFKAGLPIDTDFYRLSDSIVYSFHMPLFFALSGLFFYKSLSKRGVAGLIGSKIDTVIYPYLIWSIIQGVIEASLSSYTNGNVTYREVFSLLWQPRAQFWFLYALFIIFVVASVLFSKLSVKSILPVFVFAALLYIFQSKYSSNYFVFFITNNLVYFVFGMLLNQWNRIDILSSGKMVIATAAGFILSQYVFHFVLELTYGQKGLLSLLLALISILFVVSLSMYLARKPAQWFLQVGASSMAIYVMHILAGSGVRVILSKFLEVNSVSVHLIVGCFMGVIAPMIAVYFINRLKLTFFLSLPISQYLAVFSKKQAIEKTH